MRDGQDGQTLDLPPSLLSAAIQSHCNTDRPRLTKHQPQDFTLHHVLVLMLSSHQQESSSQIRGTVAPAGALPSAVPLPPPSVSTQHNTSHTNNIITLHFILFHFTFNIMLSTLTLLAPLTLQCIYHNMLMNATITAFAHISNKKTICPSVTIVIIKCEV